MFKIIALILFSLVFIFNIFMYTRAYLARKRPIPEEVKDVYDEVKFAQYKAYSADKEKVKIIFSTISFIVSFVLLITDVYSLVSKNVTNPYLSTLIVLGIFIGSNTIVDLFSDYFLKMKVEGKYGFNNSTMGTFIGDYIKKVILLVILFVGLTCLFVWLYESIGDYILILFSAIIFVIVLFVGFLFPLLSKASNKFASLEEGDLRTRLMDMLTKYGYKVKDIKVMDASRRTTKSNAYFTGFGKTKTIVLYDNMLKVMSDDEIVAVFAHEMAHGLHKDSLKKSVFSLFSIIVLVALAWLLVRFPEFYADFDFNNVNYGFGVVLLIEILVPIIFTFLNIPSLVISRKAEYNADDMAVKEGYGEQLISGLKKLYKENFGDVNPDPLVVTLTYSHPTLAQRIKNIKKEKDN